MYISLAFVLVNIYSMAFVEAAQSLPTGDSSDSAIQYKGGADVVCIAQRDRTQIPYLPLPVLQPYSSCLAEMALCSSFLPHSFVSSSERICILMILSY